MIPRRIIQTGRSKELSALSRASATNLRLLHPDWEYLYFDDSDVDAFMGQECQEYRDAFERFPHHIQRFDFFRYLVVYNLGGFYFDTDVLLYESLESIRGEQAVFPFEEITLNQKLRRLGVDWEIGNYAFGATAGSPFVGALIANCVRAIREPQWVAEMLADVPRWYRAEFDVLCSTGPAMATRTLAESRELAQSVRVLFPDDVCDTTTWHQFGGYGTHLMEGSWRANGSLVWRRLFWLWASRRQERLLAVSRAQGPTRTISGVREQANMRFGHSAE